MRKSSLNKALKTIILNLRKSLDNITIDKLYKENPLDWLDVILNGKMVQINGKGKIRYTGGTKRGTHK